MDTFLIFYSCIGLNKRDSKQHTNFEICKKIKSYTIFLKYQSTKPSNLCWKKTPKNLHILDNGANGCARAKYWTSGSQNFGKMW